MLYPLTHRSKIMACGVNFYILNGKYYSQNNIFTKSHCKNAYEQKIQMYILWNNYLQYNAHTKQPQTLWILNLFLGKQHFSLSFLVGI